MTTAATFCVSSRHSDRRLNLKHVLLSLAACFVLTLQPAYGEAIVTPVPMASVAVGQLPAAYEVTRDNDGFILTLVGISPRDISGVQIGDQFVAADQLGILGDGDAELGSWSEFRLPLTVETETIIVALSNGASLLLPNAGRASSAVDSQKAGVVPALYLTVGSSKIFPKGSTTITVTPIGGNVGDTYSLNPLLSTTGITIYRNDPRSFTVFGNTVGSYPVQVVAYRGSIKIAQSAIVSLSVVSPFGWSSATGYKAPAATSVRGKMLAAAVGAVGKRSGASIYCAGADCGYLTDVTGDGPGLQRAMSTFVNWIGSNTTARDAQMTRDLSATGYKADQVTALIVRIRLFVKNAPVNSNQAVLDGLGIQAQCAEYVQRLASNAGASSARGNNLPDFKTAAPGMSLRSEAYLHSALIADVLYDANGAPMDYAVIDANYPKKGDVTGGWSNPLGDIPWERLVRRVPVSEHHGINAYTLRSHSDETIAVGTPK